MPTNADQLPPIDPKRFYEWNVKESKQDAEKTIVSEFYRYLGSLRNVIDPNNIGSDTMGMEPYLRTVETCDILVFSRINGMITAGVGAEVNHALKHGKVVYEIKGNKLGRINEPVEYLTYEETRLLYGGWL